MKGYLLDTSVVIDYLHGVSKVLKLVASLDQTLNSSFVVLCELFEGVFRVLPEEKEMVRSEIKVHFASYGSVFGLDEAVSEKFGEIRTELKNRGQMIEDLDILIAATCLVHDQTLVTKNPKHFARIHGLSIREV